MDEFNNEKKKSANIYKILFISVFAILIGLIGYLTLTRVLDSKKLFGKEETKEEETTVKVLEKDLNINSGLVQSLYSLVNIDLVPMEWKYGEGTTAEDMSYKDKFELALNTLQSLKYDQVNCINIEDEITAIYGTELYIQCGDSYYDRINYEPETKKWDELSDFIPYAQVYKEKDIKAAMYRIFGKDYYERKNKVEISAITYTYINSLEGYVAIYEQKGGIRPTYNETLVSAKEINDEIVITTEGKSETNATLTYTFKFNKEDNSYYFNKIEITKK